MSVSDLQKKITNVERELKNAKRMCFETMNIRDIADDSEIRAKTQSQKEKDGIIAAIKEVVGGDDISDENAGTKINSFFENLQKKYEDVSATNDAIEAQVVAKKKELKKAKKRLVIINEIDESRGYIKYCKKRLKNMKAIVEYTRDDILVDINKMKKRVKRLLAKQEAEQEEEISEYKKVIKKKKEKQQAQTRFVYPTIDHSNVDALIPRCDEINEKSIALASRLDVSIEKVKKLQKTNAEKLMKQFLFRLMVQKKLSSLSESFIKSVKAGELEIKNPYEEEIQKVQEEVNQKKKEREELLSQTTDSNQDIDKEIAELEAILTAN